MFRRNAKALHPLRYLVYASESKIDMLLDQIPERMLRELAVDVKVDLKLVSVGVTPKFSASHGEGKAAKLAVVEHHIEKTESIGGLDATGGYFRARVDLDWAIVDETVVLFAGRQGDRLVFLGGSSTNLLGGGHLAPGLGSHANVMQQELAKLVAGDQQSNNIGAYAPTAFNEIVKHPRRAEFLARHMAHGRVDQPSLYHSYIIGSPLHVELIDEN